MSKEKEANRVIKKRSAHYKDVISGLSYITNRKTFIIFTILAEGDYEAPFLINISIERKKRRLIVSVLLNIRYQLSAVIDY